MKMKFTLIAVASIFLLSCTVYGQDDYELLHFPQEGMIQGVVYQSGFGGTEDYGLFYEEDTIVCDKRYSQFSYGEGYSLYTFYENGKVYKVSPNDCDYQWLWYDFSLERLS